MTKLLDKLRADKRVDEISVEGGMASYRASYFVHLAHGWRYGDAHCFGEDRLTDVRRTLGAVEPCDCLECRTKGEQWEDYDHDTGKWYIRSK